MFRCSNSPGYRLLILNAATDDESHAAFRPPARALLLFNLRRAARDPYMKELARSKMGPNCITSSGKGPFRKIFFYVTYSRTRFKEGLTEINHLFQNYNAYFYGIDVWLKVFILQISTNAQLKFSLFS
jgi:hypothetical protein